MESADWGSIIPTHSRCDDDCELTRPRSNLFCHHLMIACAIGGNTPSRFTATALKSPPAISDGGLLNRSDYAAVDCPAAESSRNVLSWASSAHTVRAFLLAKATAATFLLRRASRCCSHTLVLPG